MSYKIIPTEEFKQQVRILIKDYPHIKNDLKTLHKMLTENPKTGSPLGRKSYKIRLKCSDISKGKRGGYRIITFINDGKMKVHLLTIYIKTRKSTVSDEEIKAILDREGLL